MRKSLLDTKKCVCFMCGRYGPTEVHHIFGGTANRRLSEEDGLWVYLCHSCHNEPPDGVHFNKKTREWLQKIGQRAYEENLIYDGLSPDEATQKFIERYGKNYI